MKTITDDPEAFFDTGGWTFLDPESDVSHQIYELHHEKICYFHMQKQRRGNLGISPDYISWT